jgi:branched-chain amino acid transport system ATP-binding protein
VLIVRDIHYAIAAKTILDGVSLEVGPNEVVALVGGNGAGKTALLEVIAGLRQPSGGEVTLWGASLVGLAPEHVVERGVAYVPRARHLFSSMTVRENLELGAWRVGRADLDLALEHFPALLPHLDRPVGTMSGGEQQMCAIARALMSQPTVLLIDELSVGLAPLVAEELLMRLPDFAASGISVLLVEQMVEAALTVAERAWVLERGRVVASGPCGWLLARSALGGGLADGGVADGGDVSDWGGRREERGEMGPESAGAHEHREGGQR